MIQTVNAALGRYSARTCVFAVTCLSEKHKTQVVTQGAKTQNTKHKSRLVTKTQNTAWFSCNGHRLHDMRRRKIRDKMPAHEQLFQCVQKLTCFCAYMHILPHKVQNYKRSPFVCYTKKGPSVRQGLAHLICTQEVQKSNVRRLLEAQKKRRRKQMAKSSKETGSTGEGARRNLPWMNADEKGRGSQDVNRSSVNTTRHVHVTFEHLTNPRNLDRARRTARRTHNHFAGPT